MTEMIIAIVALAIGGILGWLLRGSGAPALATARAQIEGLDRELLRARKETDDARSQLRSAEKECAKLGASLEAEQRQAAEKLALLQSAREELSREFKVLAADVLDEKSKRFAEETEKDVSQLLKPLETKLKDFQDRVERVHVTDVQERSVLTDQLKQLMGLNQQLSADATSLTRALKGSGKVQGDWGEVVLQRILEASGLRKDIDYTAQRRFKNEEGQVVKPDIVVRLPEERTLVIDSKASVTAYNEYANAETEDDREQALKEHLASVRRHVKDLAAKSYEYLELLRSPDYVVMFIPLEPAFLLAINKDERLWEDAYKSGILLVSPTTLLFVLRTVAHLWKAERQKQNVVEIAKRGAELYDKFVGFVEELHKVGKSLEDATAAYQQAHARLATGKGNVIRQVEMLKALGLKSKKSLPEGLVELASQDELELLEAELEEEPGSKALSAGE